MDELPAVTSTSWTEGPAANSTELTIRQAADRLGVSVSTVRRRIKAGTLPAYKRPGPDGLEYRIPVAALGDEQGGDVPTRATTADHDLALARQEIDLLRAERDRLLDTETRLTRLLAEALAKLPPALPPAPAEPARRWFRRKRAT